MFSVLSMLIQLKFFPFHLLKIIDNYLAAFAPFLPYLILLCKSNSVLRRISCVSIQIFLKSDPGSDADKYSGIICFFKQ